MSPAAFYQYFPNREAITVDVVKTNDANGDEDYRRHLAGVLTGSRVSLDAIGRLGIGRSQRTLAIAAQT